MVFDHGDEPEEVERGDDADDRAGWAASVLVELEASDAYVRWTARERSGAARGR